MCKFKHFDNNNVNNLEVCIKTYSVTRRHQEHICLIGEELWTPVSFLSGPSAWCSWQVKPPGKGSTRETSIRLVFGNGYNCDPRDFLLTKIKSDHESPCVLCLLQDRNDIWYKWKYLAEIGSILKHTCWLSSEKGSRHGYFFYITELNSCVESYQT